MSGVVICAWCGSADTQHGLDKVTCLGCGNSTDYEGQRAVADSQAEEGVTVADIPEPEPVDTSEPTPAPEVPAEPEPQIPNEPADTPDE